MVDKRIPSSNTTGGALPTETDLATLAKLISGSQSDEHADKDLAALLEQLDRADSVAHGMEGQLDLLLEQLDGMVQGLESSHTKQPVGGEGEIRVEAGAEKASDDISEKSRTMHEP